MFELDEGMPNKYQAPTAILGRLLLAAIFAISPLIQRSGTIYPACRRDSDVDHRQSFADRGLQGAMGSGFANYIPHSGGLLLPRAMAGSRCR
ncbi:MAG: hypothetical protein P8Z76_21415 [Alphaproteobacteria bacterium]